MPSRRPLHSAALAALVAVGAACSSSARPIVPTVLTITSGDIVFTEIGQSDTITAEVRDQDGDLIQGASLGFTTDDPLVATVSGAGVVTATGFGDATITVRSGGAFGEASATVRVEVRDSRALTAVIEASPLAVPAGDANRTEVRLYGGNSLNPDGGPLAYAWAAPGGTFIGPRSGASARVTFPGGTDQRVTLTVDAGGGSRDDTEVRIAGADPLPEVGTFDIELVPLQPIESAEARDAFDRAEATWESLIRNDLPDVAVDLSTEQASECFAGAPAVSDTIDDLRIYISVENIDGVGGTLAQAGPCLVRVPVNDPATTIFGVLRVDASDLSARSEAAVDRIILHEMAHVLGLGTLWVFNGLLENPSCPDIDGDGTGDCSSSDPVGPDTRFSGEAASRAYRALGGALDATVPVENGDGRAAGPGTRDGHWRESVFGPELMTGFLELDGPNPLSLVTAAALADLGYLVDFSRVDDFSLPGDPPFPVASVTDGGRDGELDLSGDLVTGPILGITSSGDIVVVRPGR